MISGRQVLASIDQTLNNARSKVDNVEKEIEAINSKLQDDQKSLTEDFRQLARVRLGMLADNGLTQHIDEVEKQVIYLLDLRTQALEKLSRGIKDAEKTLLEMDINRQQQLENLESAAAIVDAAEAETQKKLDVNTGYEQQREQTRAAERKAQHAAEKATRSDEERQTKGLSYQRDVLFMYLWQRQYGLPEYRYNTLTRWLDGKVARLIGFADARANYSRLNEIPERLQEHATTLEAAALSEYETLKILDTQARETDGIPALESRLADEQASLDSIDKSIEQLSSNMQALTEDRVKYATGDDEYSIKALNYLSAEYQRDDLMELRREAMSTPFPDDDLIISRLMEKESHQKQLESSIQGMREIIQQNQKQKNEIEALRTDFKRSKLDRPGSQFSDKAMITMMLSQLINGMMDRQTVWNVLQEQQHYQPQHSDTTFGSGGYGRGTVWNGGLGDIAREIGRGMRGGFGSGMGRGGFGGSSGGGRSSGGGGFRTGGGF